MPITRYCDEHHLTPRQRLELFIPVCQAMQHAHQKGIIHRDLKPSNVLVALYDGKPVPKVIDFGVAKAAGQPLTEKTLVTGFGAIVGTLEYMSPEQAEINQLDIDTRSDIYSLGVLLYELLTGSPPFSRKELEKAGMLEMLRVIREQEPSKPSTKLSTAEGLPTLAANRGTEPAKLTRLVRGELDWIVMKALEKDRRPPLRDGQRLRHGRAALPGGRAGARRARRRHGTASASSLAATGGAVVTGSAVGLALLVAVAALTTSTILIAKVLRSETKAKGDLAEALEREQKDAYIHLIALAHRELSADNLRRARELLYECPERLRDWEWHYLARQCSVESHLIIRDTAEINSIAIGRGGAWIASACGDESLKIWDSGTGKLVRVIKNAHKRFASSVAFHPDGNHLASVGWDRLVKVWDLTTDPPTQVFSRECDSIRSMGTAYAVAFRPGDGRATRGRTRWGREPLGLAEQSA